MYVIAADIAGFTYYLKLQEHRFGTVQIIYEGLMDNATKFQSSELSEAITYYQKHVQWILSKQKYQQ